MNSTLYCYCNNIAFFCCKTNQPIRLQNNLTIQKTNNNLQYYFKAKHMYFRKYFKCSLSPHLLTCFRLLIILITFVKILRKCPSLVCLTCIVVVFSSSFEPIFPSVKAQFQFTLSGAIFCIEKQLLLWCNEPSV